MNKLQAKIDSVLFWLSQEDKLFRSIKSGDKERVQKLLKEGLSPNIKKESGITPLIAASIAGKRGPLEVLLRAGANVNEADNNDRNPLIHASKNGHGDIVNMLLCVDPEINKRDVDGFSATNYADLKKFKDIKEELNNAGGLDNMPIHKLLKDDKIKLSCRGQDITSVNLNIKNNSPGGLDVSIPKGTTFDNYNRPDSFQRMVVTEEENFSLDKGGRFEIKLKAACLDAEKEIPRSNSTFNNAEMAERDIVRILNKLEGQHPMTKQAAIWAYSAKYEPDQLFEKLRKSSGASSISHENIAMAKRILEDLRLTNYL